VTTLCGELTYTIEAGDLNDFITYSAEEKRISIYAEDMSLLTETEYEYTISAVLVKLPGRVLASETGVITLTDPCDSPFYLSSVESVTGSSDYSEPAAFKFPETTVAPSICME
jgi:hypothetical protein